MKVLRQMARDLYNCCSKHTGTVDHKQTVAGFGVAVDSQNGFKCTGTPNEIGNKE